MHFHALLTFINERSGSISGIRYGRRNRGALRKSARANFSTQIPIWTKVWLNAGTCGDMVRPSLQQHLKPTYNLTYPWTRRSFYMRLEAGKVIKQVNFAPWTSLFILVCWYPQNWLGAFQTYLLLLLVLAVTLKMRFCEILLVVIRI